MAARSSELATVGVDAEPWAPLDPRTYAFISTAVERRHFSGLNRDSPEVPWCRLTFTAKEAAFKALSPLGLEPRFSDATVDFSGYDVVVTWREQCVLRGQWSRPKESDVALTVLWASRPLLLGAPGRPPSRVVG